MAAQQTPTPPKGKKDESFFDIIGSLARKKKPNDEPLTAHQIEEEGRQAIDAAASPAAVEIGPDDIADNEEVKMIDPDCKNDPKLLELQKVLIDWINDELADSRIIIKDLKEDMFDGQILQKLLEKLSGLKVGASEVSQTKQGQKEKLRSVLAMVNQILQLPPNWHTKWNVDEIHAKHIVPILHLLVALVRYYRAPIRLPDNVRVTVVIVQKKEGGVLIPRKVIEEITAANDDIGLRFERDAFDTLFDHAPEKLQVVKQSLIGFVNKHLNKINLEINDLETQFHDGVHLVLLMGLLEGYFVPLHDFHLTPETNEQKVHNVAFSFELMQDAGLPKPKARPEDVVNHDLKSTLRVLYNLFTKYKAIG